MKMRHLRVVMRISQKIPPLPSRQLREVLEKRTKRKRRREARRRSLQSNR